MDQSSGAKGDGPRPGAIGRPFFTRPPSDHSSSRSFSHPLPSLPIRLFVYFFRTNMSPRTSQFEALLFIFANLCVDPQSAILCATPDHAYRATFFNLPLARSYCHPSFGPFMIFLSFQTGRLFDNGLFFLPPPPVRWPKEGGAVASLSIEIFPVNCPPQVRPFNACFLMDDPSTVKLP